MAIESIERLTVQLGRLPGIGRKTAARLAYHILGVPPEQAEELAKAITDARSKVHNCPVCGTYTDGELCEICADPRRRADVICVVSDPKDVIAMEKTREFTDNTGNRKQMNHFFAILCFYMDRFLIVQPRCCHRGTSINIFLTEIPIVFV